MLQPKKEKYNSVLKKNKTKLKVRSDGTESEFDTIIGKIGSVSRGVEENIKKHEAKLRKDCAEKNAYEKVFYVSMVAKEDLKKKLGKLVKEEYHSVDCERNEDIEKIKTILHCLIVLHCGVSTAKGIEKVELSKNKLDLVRKAEKVLNKYEIYKMIEEILRSHSSDHGRKKELSVQDKKNIKNSVRKEMKKQGITLFDYVKRAVGTEYAEDYCFEIVNLDISISHAIKRHGFIGTEKESDLLEGNDKQRVYDLVKKELEEKYEVITDEPENTVVKRQESIPSVTSAQSESGSSSDLSQVSSETSLDKPNESFVPEDKKEDKKYAIDISAKKPVIYEELKDFFYNKHNERQHLKLTADFRREFERIDKEATQGTSKLNVFIDTMHKSLLNYAKKIASESKGILGKTQDGRITYDKELQKLLCCYSYIDLIVDHTEDPFDKPVIDDIKESMKLLEEAWRKNFATVILVASVHHSYIHSNDNEYKNYKIDDVIDQKNKGIFKKGRNALINKIENDLIPNISYSSIHGDAGLEFPLINSIASDKRQEILKIHGSAVEQTNEKSAKWDINLEKTIQKGLGSIRKRSKSLINISSTEDDFSFSTSDDSKEKGGRRASLSNFFGTSKKEKFDWYMEKKKYATSSEDVSSFNGDKKTLTRSLSAPTATSLGQKKRKTSSLGSIRDKKTLTRSLSAPTATSLGQKKRKTSRLSSIREDIQEGEQSTEQRYEQNPNDQRNSLKEALNLLIQDKGLSINDEQRMYLKMIYGCLEKIDQNKNPTEGNIRYGKHSYPNDNVSSLSYEIIALHLLKKVMDQPQFGKNPALEDIRTNLLEVQNTILQDIDGSINDVAIADIDLPDVVANKLSYSKLLSRFAISLGLCSPKEHRYLLAIKNGDSTDRTEEFKKLNKLRENGYIHSKLHSLWDNFERTLQSKVQIIYQAAYNKQERQSHDGHSFLEDITKQIVSGLNKQIHLLKKQDLLISYSKVPNPDRASRKKFAEEVGGPALKRFIQQNRKKLIDQKVTDDKFQKLFQKMSLEILGVQDNGRRNSNTTPEQEQVLGIEEQLFRDTNSEFYTYVRDVAEQAARDNLCTRTKREAIKDYASSVRTALQSCLTGLVSVVSSIRTKISRPKQQANFDDVVKDCNDGPQRPKIVQFFSRGAKKLRSIVTGRKAQGMETSQQTATADDSTPNPKPQRESQNAKSWQQEERDILLKQETVCTKRDSQQASSVPAR